MVRLQTEPEEAAPIGARPEEAEYLEELGDLVAPVGAQAARPRDAEARFSPRRPSPNGSPT